MRWHTARYESPTETSAREEVIRRIDAFWAAFREAAPTIDRSFSVRDAERNFDLAKWMRMHLGAVAPDLMWEFGPALTGKRHRLVITPEGSRYLRPLNDELLRRAPDCDFEFYGDRLAETLDEGIEMAQARTGFELVVTGIGCTRGAGNRVDLRVSADADADSDTLNLAWSQAIIICNTLLGEGITDRWLGYIDVVASSTPEPRLETLKYQFESVVDECRRARQPRHYFEVANESEWTLFKMEPPDGEITRRSDLFVYRTMDQAFLEAVDKRLPFYSERFSSHGEQFCYLMLDGREAEMEGFRDKADIEDALDATLVPQRLGAVVGSGTGTRYSYIDLAVTDVEKACRAMIEVLRRGRVVTNAWILFHDDEWHDEWVGVYDETPPPISQRTESG